MLEKDLTDARLLKVPVDDAVIQLSRGFIRRHALRPADSIQLASAVLASKKLGGELSFVCADQTLVNAARLERLSCIGL